MLSYEVSCEVVGSAIKLAWKGMQKVWFMISGAFHCLKTRHN